MSEHGGCGCRRQPRRPRCLRYPLVAFVSYHVNRFRPARPQQVAGSLLLPVSTILTTNVRTGFNEQHFSCRTTKKSPVHARHRRVKGTATAFIVSHHEESEDHEERLCQANDNSSVRTVGPVSSSQSPASSLHEALEAPEERLGWLKSSGNKDDKGDTRTNHGPLTQALTQEALSQPTRPAHAPGKGGSSGAPGRSSKMLMCRQPSLWKRRKKRRAKTQM